MRRTIIVLSIGTVILDAAESVLSRSAGTPYAAFMLQIVVYLGIGFILRRRAVSLRDTALTVALTALVGSTVGEAVAVGIGSISAMPLAQAAMALPMEAVLESVLAIGGFALGSTQRAELTRTIVTMVAAVVSILAIDLVLIGLSLASGNRDWWNGFPVVIAFVVLGIGVQRFSALPDALLGVAAAALVAATLGFWLVDLLHAPGTGPRPVNVFDDDTPWTIGGFTLIGAVGVALGSVRLRKTRP
jgi:hypothetical protein